MLSPRWTAQNEPEFNRQAARWLDAVKADEAVPVDPDELERVRQLVDRHQLGSSHRTRSSR